jgi:predicted nucleic acid-binding protein
MAAIYVIDASAVIKAFVEEEGSVQARTLLASNAMLLAPAHALGECAEILVRKVALSQLTEAQVMETLTALRNSIGYMSLDGLISTAAMIALETGASVYDTLYAATAKTVGCSLVTADERLIRKLAVGDMAGQIVSLGALRV